MQECVKVELGERGYNIHLGHGFTSSVELRGDSTAALIISDDHVDPIYGDALQCVLKKNGFCCSRSVIPAGESSKNLTQAGALYEAAWHRQLDRKSLIVALGGGVPGDLAGFVAATYLRGVQLLQVPTSLLAMVDSSVGGKTAINLSGGKNLVGAFYQPRQVAINIDTLQTLPDREYRSGLAEVIKYGIIRDRSFFDWLEKHVAPLNGRDTDALRQVIARCCGIKADVVRLDERESGLRAILNYGHTLGHAIENVAGYGTLLHGEAVALGMVYAGRLSCHERRFSEAEAARIVDLLQRVKLPVLRKYLPGHITWDALREAMSADKKAQRAIPTFVLAEKIGSVSEGWPMDENVLRETFEKMP